jgi:hypothetical protein
MTVTVDNLAKRLGFAVTPADTEKLEEALGTARAVIWPGLIVDALSPDQQYALDFATIKVAMEAYRYQDATGGVYQFADGNDIPTSRYLARDQLKSVLPALIEAGLYPAAVIA